PGMRTGPRPMTLRKGDEAVGAGAPSPAAAGAPKVGRNDPCHCGSGQKYKKCHGR
ncbi:MAG: SEC-C metal-binding domain-containing protein, partial [Chloroflexota bacterium]